MAVQKGKDLLLKVDTTGSGGFTTIAGLRTKSIGFNANTVDITDSDSSGRWRELLAGAGVRNAAVSGTGIFKDTSADGTVRDMFFNGEVRDWQVVVPDFGTVEGPFQLTALEYRGEHAGEVVFEMTLASAGAVTFTAA